MSAPGKGADRRVWEAAVEGLREGRGAGWFVDLAAGGRSARKAVAAALAGEDGAAIRAALAEAQGEDGPVDKLLRRAEGREAAARVRRNPIARNEGFLCARCGLDVPPAPGSAVRNHCPRCLCSLHVDGATPGDRASSCHGLMEPSRAELRDGGWRLEQVCSRCGHRRWNRLHPDWSVAPDSLDALP